MENQSQVDNKQLVITIPTNQATDQHDDQGNAAAPATPAIPGTVEAAKKKRGGNQILQAAMFLLRRRPSKKSLKAPSVERVASKNAWKRFVGSIRPLHLQDNPSSPSSPIFEIAAPSTPTGSEAGYEDVLPPPMSPAHATDFMSRSSSEDSMQSRYASAVNLQELDRSEQDEDKNKGKSADIYDGEDEHIDAKAEEFIAQFYHQMKLQPLD
ncbi:uncharacterized protein LOC126794968 [Argentina anserina]|uniref:uncharacterized protein LOC126794968 n=1 Tax=Argentina anserina TaxID=57926 RepID=UPI0021767AE0|nr:uncharacterized protein LOC126794968 [Potentilla anserina]